MGTGVDSGAGRPPSPMPPRTPSPVPPRPDYPPPLPRYHAFPAPPYTPPGAGRRARGSSAAAVCLVLGIGLLCGAAAGSWLAGDKASAQPAGDRPAVAFADARGVWHSAPVDTLFPRTLAGPAAGPGRADRTWTRIGVAPDSACDGAFDPALASALAPVGCVRLLRATYTDATSSNVTTVGLLITRADPAGMAALAGRWNADRLGDRTDAIPRTVPFPGTVSAGFGAAQRGSWTVRIADGLPVVVYAVSGFADGRAVTGPQPAAAATADGATSVPAQSGLGNDAAGVANAIEQRLAAAAHVGIPGAAASAAAEGAGAAG